MERIEHMDEVMTRRCMIVLKKRQILQGPPFTEQKSERIESDFRSMDAQKGTYDFDISGDLMGLRWSHKRPDKLSSRHNLKAFGPEPAAIT